MHQLLIIAIQTVEFSLILTQVKSFIYLGIAQGVQKAGFDMTELGLRYMLVGLVMNFFSGWVTDFTTKDGYETAGNRIK